MHSSGIGAERVNFAKSKRSNHRKYIIIEISKKVITAALNKEDALCYLLP